LKAGFLAGVPFKANKVIRSYHKGPSWFVELNNGEHVPIQLLMGVLAKTIEAFGEII
jgi:hypothetical protein